jgi:molybdopterin synthase sulfur carrier subunit
VKIAVQFYAQLRDEVGTSELNLELKDGANVQAALATLYEEQPSIARWDSCLLTAMGVEYIARDHVLNDGETLLLFPPVQGG